MQPVGKQEDKLCLIPAALQVGFLSQSTVLLGVISDLTGNTLQEDMVKKVQGYHTRGQMILDMVSGTFGGMKYDREASVGAGTVAQGP